MVQAWIREIFFRGMGIMSEVGFCLKLTWEGVYVRWPIAAATLQLNLMSDVHVEFDNLAQTESTNTFVG